MKGRDVRTRLARAGRRQAELARFMSEKLGHEVSVKSVSRLVTEDRRIGVEEAAAIEEFFRGEDYFPVTVERPRAGKVPLYGMAAGASFDGIAYSSDHVLDWLDAPAINVDAAFRVAGTSMEPRLFAGETVFVKLGMPPAKGDDAVIEFKDERQGVIIKTYQGQREGFVFLSQWNPVAEVRVRYDEVRALHAVRLRA
jgi:phage repressor protein C with HTH and peptisase S24 domain